MATTRNLCLSAASALILLVMLFLGGQSHAQVSTHTIGECAAVPTNLISSATPEAMINASNDHQLFFKAYNDYSDLDNDNVAETTYKHTIDYYGYFDSYKCYEYDAGDQRFEPRAVTADKYCTGANDTYWSGNFLNWATMSRIDTIRKMLFGGHRRVDTSTTTVLERAFLPPDIHSFAKHYAGADVTSLTPYTPNTAAPTGTSATSRAIATGSRDFTTQAGAWIQKGDFLTVADSTNVANYMKGWVTAFNSGTGALTVNVTKTGGAGTLASWNITNHTRTGITICNTTFAAGLTGDMSHEADVLAAPPLMRVALGNYALWAAGEVNQCLWENDDGNNVFRGGNGMNYNDPTLSGIPAADDRPDKALVGAAPYGDFNVRVQVCVPGLLGQERCKLYPHGNYKPIGLLQVYGDESLIQFGMVAGTYGKARSGGDIVAKIRNIDKIDGMCREINLGIDCDKDGNVDDDLVDATHAVGDGTFKLVHQNAGGPITLHTKSEGIINTWSLYRIYGYKYGDWNYSSNQGDKCPLGINFFGVESDSECTNWGNPFSEIYMSSLRYYAGENSPIAYQSGDGQYIQGINYSTGVWKDPLDTVNYCARLNIINFNSSVSSMDTFYASDTGQDELDTASFGVVKDLGSTQTSKQLTDIIGQYEGIHGQSWFVGENGTDNNHRCTQKTVASLGDARGLCPEGPDLRGGFRIAGLAYYAHVNDIRPATLTGGRALTGSQKVDTFSIKMATGSPIIEIPVPGSATGQKVTLIPSCIDNDKADYGCTMADFKVIQPHTEVAGVGTGKFLVIWEDSLQGNDYDLDAGGTISYTITATQITVTTAITLQNLGYSIGSGYVISGTTQDGLHIHSGTNNFAYNDPTAIVGCEDGDGCSMGDGTSSRTYTIGASTAGLLQDPLWYAAKWGGFLDSNGNNRPDLQSEWDKENNLTGDRLPDTNGDGFPDGDGIPDNYFYASNPLEVEGALNRTFLNILRRVSSGTAAAVVSNNVSGEGALYQAYYEPQRQDSSGNSASWLGTVQSLWLDSYGYLREDGDQDAQLDNYATDKVIQFYYDDDENKTRVRRYTSTDATTFTPYYMQGTVTAYNATTGALTFTVSEHGGAVGSGPYTEWTVYNLSNNRNTTSTTSSSIVAGGAKTITLAADVVPPAPDPPIYPTWLHVGDTVMMAHFDTAIIELENVGSIWNARKQLYFTAATDLALQRNYTSLASTGRYITTWIDDDLDGIVDSGEYVDFLRTNAMVSGNYGFFDVADGATAQNVVDYIRGKEIAGYRSRRVDYDGTGVETQRLGDIINSTPTLVPAPQEGFDLLYRDTTYPAFKSRYANRRNMLYVGANDGLLHAFNGGFYDKTAKKFNTAGTKPGGGAAVAHPLGSELWAYAPMNLLPHLKWLTAPDYMHRYYMDGKPRVFDAKIFTPDADHPNGWGTVLVAGMRFGGCRTTVDTAADGLGGGHAADDRTMRSSYVVMDITNPEIPPQLLAEFQLPNGSFSFAYPAVMTFKDKLAAADENKWFLIFGSGPDNLASATNPTATAASTSTAKLYFLDMAEFSAPGTTHTPAVASGCTLIPLTSAATTLKVISCDTGAASTFVGTPMAVDWELNYKADAVYLGLVGNATANSGRLMRFAVSEESDPAHWNAPLLSTLINVSQPVTVTPTPGMDNNGNKWIYFGTGRLFENADKSSTTTQSIYGIKDSGVTVNKNLTDLVNATNIQVFTNGTIINGPAAAIDTFTELVDEMDTNKKGWYIDLAPITGAAGTAPATRVLSDAALVGGILFSSAYQPSTDLCTGEGFSDLYGLYYKTGTAYANPTVFGVQDTALGEMSLSHINLGRGFATSPAVHSGSDTGEQKVSVFTQLSTGTIIRSEAGTASSVRSGFRFWRER